MNEVCLWIKEAREDAGLKQYELARLTGYTPSYISVLERGQRPTVDVLERIEKALGERYEGEFDRERPPHRRSDWRYIDDPDAQAKARLWMRMTRERQGLTMRELASRAFVSYATVKNIELRDNTPHEDIWQAIETALGERFNPNTMLDKSYVRRSMRGKKSSWEFANDPVEAKKARVWMQRRREKLRMTQSTVARLVGISHIYYSKLEREDDRMPSQRIWYKIQGVFGKYKPKK